MGLIQKLVESRAGSPENPRNGFEAVFDAMDFGASTNAGKRINEKTAMQMSAVYAAVRVHTDTVASVPLLTYNRLKEGGKERATNHRIYDLLRVQPNPLMSSFTFRETLQGHISLWGNGYAEIQYDNMGKPIALWPLLPDRTRVVIKGDKKWFLTKMANQSEVALPGHRVLHIPGFGGDGISGQSVISNARESLAVGAAAEEYGARFFGQGAKAAGVLEHPGNLSKPGAENLQKSWQQAHGGLTNSHRVAILEEGMKFTQTSIPPEDSQFLETRQFSVTEVARWFKVKPHKIADLSRSTFSNIEAENISSYQDMALPWFVRWEQALQMALLTKAERKRMVIEFQADGLLRGDTTSRGEFYTKLFQLGALSPNDILELENRNPVEGGDQRFVPLNMIPLAQAESFAQVGASDEDDRSAKIREQRGVQARVRQRGIQKPLIRSVASRVLKRELGILRREIKKAFDGRAKRDFGQFIDEFYSTFAESVQKDFAPVLRAYANMVLDATISDSIVDQSEYNDFVRTYVGQVGQRWSARSRAQLTDILRNHPPEEVVAALEQRLSEWEEKRPDKVADEETTRGGEAFTRAAMVALGVTAFRWVTVGENCPLCNSMNGKVVGRSENFAAAGEEIEGEGVAPLTTRTTVAHPPLHQGCNCVVLQG